ncbi:MAG: hypothetical protein M3Q16_03455 [Pseudomonadota bacterium]|nr:hypothetical protein [Pseudomonadota bacterium]
MERFQNTVTKKRDSVVIKKDRWLILKRAIVSGTLGGYGAAIAALLAGKYENGFFAGPLNATSHIIWGDEAVRQNRFSLKFTFTGFMLNHGSGIFWALFYEKLFGKGARKQKNDSSLHSDLNISFTKPLLGAAVIAASAYVIDYHLIPRRFTPGFEHRVSVKSLAVILAALAVGLATRDIISARQNRQKSRSVPLTQKTP